MALGQQRRLIYRRTHSRRPANSKPQQETSELRERRLFTKSEFEASSFDPDGRGGAMDEGGRGELAFPDEEGSGEVSPQETQ